MITGLQRVSRNALIAELAASSPLDRPPVLAVCVLCDEIHKRVRVAPQELSQLAFQRDLVGLVVGCGKRVMGVDATRRCVGCEHSGKRDEKDETSHNSSNIVQ